jgi:hypothetical protein
VLLLQILDRYTPIRTWKRIGPLQTHLFDHPTILSPVEVDSDESDEMQTDNEQS